MIASRHVGWQSSTASSSAPRPECWRLSLAELAVTKQLASAPSAWLGILGSTSRGDEDVSVSLIGVNNVVGAGTGDDVAGYVGLGASVVPAGNLILELDRQAVFGGESTSIQAARITKHF